LGRESITLNDAVGALASIEPDLFGYEPMAGDVETEGELTRGASVFDRRPCPEWRTNMEVATTIDAEAARRYIIDQLSLSGNLT
jgi:purine nucleosidase